MGRKPSSYFILKIQKTRKHDTETVSSGVAMTRTIYIQQRQA